MICDCDYDCKCDTEKPNPFLYQGTLTNNETEDVKWSLIEVEFMTLRRWPICFKLKDNVYIVGGDDATTHYFEPKSLLCCDRYNLTDGKYYKSVHVLPYPIRRDGVVNVATDAQEDFAIITGSNGEGGILLFKEDTGFEEVLNFSGTRTNKKGTLFRIK